MCKKTFLSFPLFYSLLFFFPLFFVCAEQTAQELSIQHYFDRYEYLDVQNAWEEIIRLGENAITHCHSLGRFEEEATIHNQLAYYHFYLGRDTSALFHAEQGLSLSKKIQDKKYQMEALFLISAALRAQGLRTQENSQKEAIFQKSRSYIKKAQHKVIDSPYYKTKIHGKVVYNAGLLEMEDNLNGDLDLAKKYLLEAKKIYKKNSCFNDYSKACLRIANLYLNSGQCDKSLRILNKTYPFISDEKTLLYYEMLFSQIQKEKQSFEEAKTVALRARKRADKLKAIVELNKLDAFIQQL